MTGRVWHLVGLSLALACSACVEGGDDNDDDDNVIDEGEGSAGSGGREGGGASGSGGGELDTDLAPAEQLSALSEEDALQLCERTVAAAERTFADDRFETFSCTALGALLSIADFDADGLPIIDVASCQAEFQECLEDGATSSTRDQCDSEELMAELDGCDVTVEAYEACIGVTLGAFTDVFERFTCENLDDPELANALVDDPTAISSFPECSDLVLQCPRFDPLGTGDSDGGGEQPGSVCEDTCGETDAAEWVADGECDDGGPGADTQACDLGTDCTDCGSR